MCNRTGVNLKVVIFKWGRGKMTGNKRKERADMDTKKQEKEDGEELKMAEG